MTKIDLPGAQPDKVKGQLQEKGLTPEDWGGETIVIPVSAPKKIGVDKLLEAILLVAEVAELKSNDDSEARGMVVESQIEQGRGPTATVIVRSGTLRVGDSFICGHYSGKVKSLIDDAGKPIKSAGPSMPCKCSASQVCPMRATSCWSCPMTAKPPPSVRSASICSASRSWRRRRVRRLKASSTAWRMSAARCST